MRAVLAWLLLCSLACAQQRIDKPFEVGALGVLEHPEPCAWLTFDDVDWVQESSGRVYFATKPGKFKIAAMSKTEANKVLAFYNVTVGGKAPDPDDPPAPPRPPQPTPSSWQDQVKAWTLELPEATRSRAHQVATVFDSIAARCGDNLWTGPDIRGATQGALAADVKGFADWEQWNQKRFDADAEWARQAFRDSSAYKERWKETAAGIRAAVPAPAPQAAPIVRGEMVTLRAGYHQQRNGRLLEYVCPQNGQRCRWQDRGQIVERGDGWVVVQ